MGIAEIPVLSRPTCISYEDRQFTQGCVSVVIYFREPEIRNSSQPNKTLSKSSLKAGANRVVKL